MTMTWRLPAAGRSLRGESHPERHLGLVHALALTALTVVAYHHGFGHQFTNWDDQEYIVQNPLIRGFAPGRVWEAFTRFHVFNYNPLHIVSYMVDYELWGLNAGGFFLTSLCLHLATGLLVYVLARRWASSPAWAFIAAGIFLLHPTRVESVAWLSERKDVLSGFFGMAAVLAYTEHLAASGRRAAACYWGSLLLFLLALLAKSQILTLPLVLLALDVHRRRPFWAAAAAKLPFLVLSGVFATLTLHAHQGDSLHGFELPGSLLHPLAALPRYCLHVVWPVGLSPYYDYTRGGFTSAGFVVLGGAVGLALGAALLRSLRRERHWFLAIAWSLIFLAPVLGVLRTNVAMADRYLYLALVGPLLCAASRMTAARLSALGLGGAVLAACGGLTLSYVPAFEGSESLWRRVLERSPGASIAHSNLGHHYLGQGRLGEAASEYDADLAERPYFESTFLGRALIYEVQGDLRGAARMYDLALEKRPQSALARVQYAELLARAGEQERALQVMLGLEPAHATPLYYHQLFDIYTAMGRSEEARKAALDALRLAPYDPASVKRSRQAGL